MAESESFTTESGCRVRVIEQDTGFLLDLRVVGDPRRAEVALTPWELHRLHAMTFRPPRVKDVPTQVLLDELQRRIEARGK
jgi:hypothetical protein